MFVYYNIVLADFIVLFKSKKAVGLLGIISLLYLMSLGETALFKLRNELTSVVSE